MVHKESRSQVVRQPQIGEVVIVRDDYVPRRSWKLARIEQSIFSKDGLIRSAKIKLPNKNIVSRPVNHLFPLEIYSVVDGDVEFSLRQQPNTIDQAEPKDLIREAAL